MLVLQPCVVSLLVPVLPSTCDSVVGASVRLLVACRSPSGKQVAGVSWSTKSVGTPSVGGLALLGFEVMLLDRYLLCDLVLQVQSRCVALPRATRMLLARCRRARASFFECVSRSAWRSFLVLGVVA